MSNERSRRYDAWNEICDADSLWGPLLFLRPAQERVLTHPRLLLICGLFGTFYGLCGSFILAWFHHLGHVAVLPAYQLPLFLSATSFLCGELTFARAWNERARRLARQTSWAEANRRTPPQVGAPSSKSEA